MIPAMKVTAIHNDWVGRVVGDRFTLLKWLGGSNRSSVFLTELTGSRSQKAVIKLVADQGACDERVAALGFTEKLSHPHLLKLFDAGTTEVDGSRFFYVVTEYADEILADILPARALTAGEVREMVVPLLDVLGYLHSQGLVHGRLKPSNIVVVNDKLKLSIDCVRPSSSTAFKSGALTVYDAPERSAGTLTRACDLWSLGVTVVEALSQQTLDWNRAANQSPRVPGTLPDPYKRIAETCLRISPGDRGTINDIKRQMGIPIAGPDLSQFASLPNVPNSSSKPQVVPMPSSQPQVPRVTSIERNLSHKPRTGMVVFLLLIMIAVAALFWSRSHGTVPATKSNDDSPAQSSQPEAAQPQPQTPQAESAPAQNPAPQNPDTQSATEHEQPPPAPTPPPEPTRRGAATVRGAVVQRVMPNVPASASRTVQGRINVVVRVSVGPTGAVTDASFEYPGPSRYFSRISMDAARKWKFKPTLSNRQPIASVWTLHFVFTRTNTEVNPTENVP